MNKTVIRNFAVWARNSGCKLSCWSFWNSKELNHKRITDLIVEDRARPGKENRDFRRLR